MSQRGTLFVIVGPSGVGKGTLVSELLKRVPDLYLSISATTRDPRPGDREGVQYYFLTRVEFTRRVNSGQFLEWASIYGNYYGTLKETVNSRLDSGQDVILEIDIQGARQVKANVDNDSLFVFIMPPSSEELERRLRGRATDSEKAIKARLVAAREELAAAGEFDCRIVNDKIENAVDKLVAIVIKCRKRKDVIG